MSAVGQAQPSPRVNGARTATFDAVGVGIGPFNLSLAALLAPVPSVRAMLYERSPAFEWHAGLMLPEAEIQVSFLKDLVTPADPTSPYSFLAFLVAHRRLYRFVNAAFPRVTRREFNQYLQWVAASLPNLRFGTPVHAVDVDGDLLRAETDAGPVTARSVVVGTGTATRIPACARPHLGATVFPGERLVDAEREPVATAGRRVAVVGGGQTGAEVVSSLLGDDPARLPSELVWVSRRPNFLPLDESPFTNELFSPGYGDYFATLDADARARLLSSQSLAGYGISAGLLERLYRRLYELEFLDGWRGWRLLPGRELTAMERTRGLWRLTLADRLAGGTAAIDADIVVLCTGVEHRLPPCVAPLTGRLAMGGGGLPRLRDDFSAVWDGPGGLRLYVQNCSLHARGVADPNLSLMAWRSARIANSLAGRQVYDVGAPSSVFDWEPAGSSGRADAG